MCFIAACFANLSTGEKLEVDSVAHSLVSGILRVKVIAGVVAGQQAGRVGWIARGSVKVD